MTDSNYTHVILLVDRSGSMQEVRQDAQGGINQVLEELSKNDLGKLTITISDFDTEFATHCRMAPISDAPFYELVPRGMTALLDAVGKEIVQSGQDLSVLNESNRPGKVLVYIVTDGQENSSKDWNLESVRDLISEQKSKYNWNFSFIGANDAAWAGRDLGMHVSSYTPDAAGTRAVYDSMIYNIASNVRSSQYIPMPESIGD